MKEASVARTHKGHAIANGSKPNRMNGVGPKRYAGAKSSQAKAAHSESTVGIGARLAQAHEGT